VRKASFRRSALRSGSLGLLLLGGSLAAGQDLAPEEAVRRMKVPEGLEVKLVASEPAIRQPLTIDFDDQGRVWVIQYLQYPNPAGLKPVKVDQYLRTVYDRVPEPPPKGPRGADRITILEDPDDQGRFRTSKDFVTGLNIASGMALGHGGVYVAQPPYLLFYRIKPGTDEPLGDPEVLLSGFGMEDTHSVANSLQWGPDGWLYGAAGSTSTCKIRGLEFQQGLWRYHPLTHEFELFAEGGGNTWGLDFDRRGQAIAGTNFGGQAMLHQVQGAYYVKGFGKHGPLHNPYAFGYFDHVPYKDFKGGHVTCGGVLYLGGALPPSFNDTYIAGNLLSNALYWHVLEPRGSSFVAHHGGDFLISQDPWFRPVDCLIGPDGALYVVDWYDKRADHVDPRDTWDRSNGRIYKVQARKAPKTDAFDLARRSSLELVDLLSHPNDWFRRAARRILAERRDPSVLPRLEEKIRSEKGETALQALWALAVSGGFTDPVALGLLGHPNPDVRGWTVRLLGDPKRVSPEIVPRLADLARTETDPSVRNQLACTAKRLPAAQGLPLIEQLLRHSEDVEDPQIPLLLWWALEAKAVSDRAQVEALFQSPDFWRAPIAERFILERLARRYLAEGGEANDRTLATLLERSPGPAQTERLIRGMELALEGRRLDAVPEALRNPLSELWRTWSAHPSFIRLAFRLGDPRGFERALEMVQDPKTPDAARISLVEVLGQSGRPEAVPYLKKFFAEARPPSLQIALLGALQSFVDPEIPALVLTRYSGLAPAARSRAQSLLSGRPAWALELLRAVDAKRIPSQDVPLDLLLGILEFKDPASKGLIEKIWGKIGAATPGEKRAQMASLKHILSTGKGSAVRGKPIFTKTCAVCHTLFGEGAKIGPELTGQDRKTLDVLLMNIVDPSAVVRPEFQAYKVRTTAGQVLTGLLAEQTPESATILDAKGVRTVLARSKIEVMEASEISIMPEKLLDPLGDQELRDFFAYLQGEGPVQAAAADQVLPGTAPLEEKEDLAAKMVRGIDAFLLGQIDRAEAQRASLWKRDPSSREAYERSVLPNRERLRRMLGAQDERVPFRALELVASTEAPPLLGRGAGFEVYAVRWPVVRHVEGEGLLLVPVGKKPVASAVVLPDADQTPEMEAGLVRGIEAKDQVARQLAEAGVRVVVPLLIDRADTLSQSSAGRATNQPHREFVYRPAFEMGRTLIGYEVQKVLALIDHFAQEPGVPIGVFGQGEGGLVALYSGALDPRIDLVHVSGYFGPREKAWQEPIYRNVFGLLGEFGDAELASLISPRTLQVDLFPAFQIAGPPAPRQGRSGAAPGSWKSPEAGEVEKEQKRALDLVRGLAPLPPPPPLALRSGDRPPTEAPVLLRSDLFAEKRLKRQFEQLVEDTQVLMRGSDRVRAAYLSGLDKKDLESYRKSAQTYRDRFYHEVIGSFDEKFLPPRPRTRLLYEDPKVLGYEVVLDVWPEVFAYGILLLPRDLKEGERRPVVVCQHGLEGRPQDVADPKKDSPSYHRYAWRLAERGFVVYAPQNPYIGQDRFRGLQRKANLIGRQLFSIIIPQHQVTTDWLASLPFVDPERIAFYGLSYGGKSAMRIPAVVSRYCLSICSADFNEWIWKNASTFSPYSYVTTNEYEIFEWNLGNTFNYSEMAALIAPRPFMVERGHKDGVAPDEWVAYEYAKVKRHYDELGIGDRTELEIFNGPHTIHGQGTFDFLHKHLRWPKPPP
jgi:putative membrane-bound dehydrogenase-like protein